MKLLKVNLFTEADILPLFSNFGTITDIRIHPERGYGFIKLDSHENAAMAICSLNGTMIHGRPLKVYLEIISKCLYLYPLKIVFMGKR